MFYGILLTFAGVAQSVVQLIRNQQVVCSSHITSSNPLGFYRAVLLYLPIIPESRTEIKSGAGFFHSIIPDHVINLTETTDNMGKALPLLLTAAKKNPSCGLLQHNPLDQAFFG